MVFAMTKQGLIYLNRFLNSGITSLYQCYNNCSHRKHRSFTLIEEHIDNLRKQGYKVSGIRIISYCITNYTCGYMYYDGGKYFLNIETYRNTYVFELNSSYGEYLW